MSYREDLLSTLFVDFPKTEFNTQGDDRVCPVCEELDGKTFEPNDPDLPEIPVHPNCRCYFEDESGLTIASSAELANSSQKAGRKLTFVMNKPKTASASAGYGIETFERDGEYFAKFFLINPFKNLRNWQVTEASIPEYMGTFVGQPYIDDGQVGQRAHANLDDQDVDVVVAKQGDYKKGTIIATDYNVDTKTAAALVKIHDKAVYDGLKTGEAIYVSPAIAGVPIEQPDGSLLYHNWIGLHLARVDRPAYGVMAAAMKATCEGPQANCIKQLMAVASMQVKGHTPCSLMRKFGITMASAPNTSFNKQKVNTASMEDCTEGSPNYPKCLEEKLSEATASLKKALAENASLTKERDQYKTKAASADDLSKTVDELKQSLANADKEKIADQIIEIETASGLLAEGDVKSAKEELMKLDKPALGAILKRDKAASSKMASSLPATSDPMADNENVVRTIRTASASAAVNKDKRPETLEDARKMFNW